MLYLVEPNLRRADELVLAALRRQFGDGANFEDRSGAPGIPLAELFEDDGANYTLAPSVDHLGKVPRRLMRLVYELDVYSEHQCRPSDLPPKCTWVVDVMYPTFEGGRTAHLAVRVPGGTPALVPIPELPAELLDGNGTVADTRAAVRQFAVLQADLVNLALPTARALAHGVRNS